MSDWDQERCLELGYPHFIEAKSQRSDLRGGAGVQTDFLYMKKGWCWV